MAENATIARPYAEAAFAIADAEGTLSAWGKALDALAEVAAYREVREAIANPRLDDEQVYALVASLAGDALSAGPQKFLRVLVENDRAGLLPEIRTLFQDLRNEREGVVEALIDTAFELDASQTAGLVADLERHFKRRVSPLVRVDGGLIGGVRVTVGDEVIDASVKARLDAMETALKR